MAPVQSSHHGAATHTQKSTGNEITAKSKGKPDDGSFESSATITTWYPLAIFN
jgi:hypothetical protein